MGFDIYNLLVLSFILLIISAIIVPLFSSTRKMAGWLNFLFTLCAALPLFNISYETIFGGIGSGTRIFDLGFSSLNFLIDPFSGFFIGIISFISVMAAFYSIEYMEHYSDYKLRSYYTNFPLFILGMLGIVTTDDLSLGFSLAWQLMTISSYFLIRFEYRQPGNKAKANKYLLLMELAWAIILAGTLFIDGISFGDPIHVITEKMSEMPGMMNHIVLCMLFVGFGFKAGVFPLGQFWLPDAHSIAPSPISSLLSGVMIKTGVYGILRTFFWMMPHTQPGIVFWGIFISAAGVLSLFIGTVQSMKQSDAKRLLAYSSLGQMGYIIFGIGAGLFMFSSASQFVRILSITAIIGVVYHILNHAVFKGLLFLTSGSVLYATGTRDLNKLGGLLKIMPVSALAAGIASLSISGVPPFSGFASKWTLISSSLLAGSEVLFLGLFGIIALFTSAITLSCYVKYFGMIFTSAGAEWNTGKAIREVPTMMIIPKLILSILCIIQGVIPFYYFRIITGILKNSEGPMLQVYFNDYSIQDHLNSSAMGIRMIPGLNASAVMAPLVILIIFAAVFIFAWLLKKSAGSKEHESDAWLCGYQDLNNKNVYNDKNMFAALKSILRWAGGKE